jgi:hypothetical protein
MPLLKLFIRATCNLKVVAIMTNFKGRLIRLYNKVKICVLICFTPLKLAFLMLGL